MKLFNSKIKKCIVVCSTQRSGSSMICEDIGSTGVLGNPKEHFQKVGKEEKCKKNVNPLDQIALEGTTPNGVFAVKVMANQIGKINGYLRNIADPGRYGEHFPTNFTELFNDPIWVRVHREDALEQAISRIIARQTQVYHLKTEINETREEEIIRKRQESEYDPVLISNALNEVEEEKIIWDKFFEVIDCQPFEILYENVCDSQSYIQELGKMLNMKDVSAKKRVLRKLPNGISQEWKARFLKGENK